LASHLPARTLAACSFKDTGDFLLHGTCAIGKNLRQKNFFYKKIHGESSIKGKSPFIQGD
jgi:hypothetical protein